MNVLTAHEMFASRPDEELQSLLPDNVDVRPMPGLDPTCALLTAAVSLSGQLDSSRTQTDLDNAIEHFKWLLDSEIVTLDEWCREAEQVIHQLVVWGESASLN